MLKRTTLGGYLNVSQQLLQWQPGALQVIVEQMRARLSSKIETHFVTELAASTGKVDLAAGAAAAAVIQAIYDASAAVYGATNELATMIVCGPLGWARLGGLADAAGRPLLPSISPSNATGQATAGTFSTSIAGLQLVVSPKVTSDEFHVLNGACIEGWAYYYPLLEAVEPSVLGRQIAVAADVVAHRPTPYANAAVLVGAP
jgi:HK97 family phage major capsid protein